MCGSHIGSMAGARLAGKRIFIRASVKALRQTMFEAGLDDAAEWRRVDGEFKLHQA